jgi:hypothetical protein
LILAGKGSSGVAIGASDVVLQRDAANTLAQRNGVNVQAFRIYDTYTDVSNYRRLAIYGNGTVQTEFAGTGASAAPMYFWHSQNGVIQFGTNDTARWNITSGGHITAATDNVYDIGASGVTRPRDLFLGRNLTIGGNTIFADAGSVYFSTRSSLKSPANGVFTILNNAETDFDRLQFGGTSASFPALKRSGAGLQVRLADDTGYASIATSIVNLDKTITAGGTTGAQTINKSSGTINFAAAATSLVVTNSLVTTSSNIICTVQTNDATMTDAQCVPGSGSFTIYANAAATAETRVGFVIFN